MNKIWGILVIFIFVNCESEEELNTRIAKKAQLITEEEGFDVKSLPVESTVTRNSSACPGVTETVNTHRLNIEDDDGQLYYILMENVIVKETVRETLKIADSERDQELYRSILVRPHLNCLEPDHDDLIRNVRDNYLVPWSGRDYDFSVPIEDLDITSLEGEVGQPKEVDELVFGGEVKNGFFIEAGAFDFETNSDSLYFELNHNWTGLLVEPHPLAFHRGLAKNRRVTSVNTCLSTSGRAEELPFDLSGSVWDGERREAMSGLVSKETDKTVGMQCLPLYSLLLALGNPTVHYLSLDIEGAEFPVLTSIPWNKVDIKAVTVETHLAGRLFPGTRDDIIAFMDEVGYNHVTGAHRQTNDLRSNLGTTDDLFVRKEINLRQKDEL